MIKSIVFTLTAIFISSASWADNQDLVSRFVLSINQTLQETNARLKEHGETLYCEQLRPEQIALVASYMMNAPTETEAEATYKNLGAISVDAFVGQVADQLMCYPLTCTHQRRASLVGAICNGSAYRADMDLLYKSFSRMAGQHVPGYVSVGAAFGLPAQ